MNSSIPQPSNIAIQHSLKLAANLAQKITKQGPISFHEYMNEVLYAPGLGYYSGGSAKIGPAGDFITAPEISPVFAKCLAVQCQQVIQDLPHPIIFELGAGLGSLAADLLLALEKCDSLPAEYWILEPSAELQQRQVELIKQKCAHLLPLITWLNSPPAADFSGIILGNEVIDALAITRFTIKSDKIIELGVNHGSPGFYWCELSAPNTQLVQKISNIQNEIGPLPEGYCSEINLYLSQWLYAVTKHLKQGLSLWIDYGYPRQSYYHSSRFRGTLMAYYRHHAHDNPFLYPGLQDITAHVDFTALAEAGVENNMELAGYISQGMFLMNCGVGDFMQEIEDVTQLSRIKKLISPQHMGESFKVMALSRNFSKDLVGFSIMEERHRLSLP